MTVETDLEWWTTLGRGNFAAPRALGALLELARPEDRQGIVALMADVRAGKRPANDLTYDGILNLMGDLTHVRFRDAEILVPDRLTLKVLVEELLIHKEYHFPSERPDPLVIDGGVNFGLSLYTTKTQYPDARIIGFEPNPAMYALAVENIARNGWTNIELHQAALSSEDGRAQLELSNSDVMASSLVRTISAEPRSVEVETRRLSTFLTEPVDFLKLDIEGVEEEVLREAGAQLKLARNLFCEIHLDSATPMRRLPAILALLDAAGMKVHISRSPWADRRFSSAGLEAVGEPYSLSVFARKA